MGIADPEALNSNSWVASILYHAGMSIEGNEPYDIEGIDFAPGLYNILGDDSDERFIPIGKTYVFFGGAGNDTFDGRGFVHTVGFFGGANNDTLYASDESGSVYNGGDGSLSSPHGTGLSDGYDTLSYEGRSGGIRVNLDRPEKTVDSYFTSDSIYSIEHLVLTSYDDIVFVDDKTGQEVFNIDGGSGTDTVSAISSLHGVSIDLSNVSAGVKYEHFENVVGSEFADQIIGNDGNNSLEGGIGDDIISGGTGDDIIVGGAGNDYLAGGEGEDVVSGGFGDDRIYSDMDGDNDQYSGGFGTDTVVYRYAHGNSDVVIAPTADGTQKILIDHAIGSNGATSFGADTLDSIELAAVEAGDGRDVFDINEATDLTQFSYLDAGSQQDGIYDALLLENADQSGALTPWEKSATIDLKNHVLKTQQENTFLGIPLGEKQVSLAIFGFEKAVGGNGNDTLIASSGKIGSGEGASILDGGAGNDTLIGAGYSSLLYGGSGADTFEVGANSWIEDSNTTDGDNAYNIGIRLYGGVQQWWDESGFASWAPFSSLLAAFPVIGSELLYTAAFFTDAVTMKFVRYRLDADGTLEMNFGWGQAGVAAISNYALDLDSGLGTAGISVFSAGHSIAGDGTTVNHIDKFVNLALHAGFGVGLSGYDPLVLDLGGNGYDLTTEANSQVWFDYNHNGFAQHTGWVRGSDGFLVRDLNGNGRIDDISEMFGDATHGGFDVLAGFDANNDGIINASDAVYATLQVWQDLNGNGVTNTGELKSLADLGIVSISLATTTPPAGTEIGGDQIAQQGSFTLTNGTERGIADVIFDASPTDTRYLGDATVDAASAALPQLDGFGTIADLRIAMTQSASLKAMVTSFVGETTTDLSQLEDDAEAILFAWAGVASVAPTAIGADGFDARKLAFLEKYTGTALMPRDANGLPQLDNLTEVEQLWTDQLARLTLRLVAQGPMAAAFAGVTYHAENDLLIADSATSLGDILHRVIAGLEGKNHEAALAQWAQWAPLLGALTDSMVRSDANTVKVDYLFEQLVRAADGTAQPLSLAELASGLSIGDLRLGTSAVDNLTRSSAADTVVYYGAGGDDTLDGGTGQDVYVFGHEIGHTVINDNEPNPSGDRIRFAFLNPNDVTVTRDGNDLLITVDATQETIRITGQFAPVVPLGSDVLLSSNKGVEDIQFADGTIWEEPEIATAVGMGSDGNDHLVGTMHSDVLTGGKGDDLLEGGDDADLYVINAGDGHDTIHDVQTSPLLRSADMVVFGAGLAPSDLVMARQGQTGDDLLFTVAGTGQTLLIQSQFAYTSLGYNAAFAPNTRIEAFAFRDYADGWSIKDVQQTLIAQSSTNGDDTIMGFGDDDVIDGGKGNDTLVGLDGQDTYLWGKGDGNDTIDERAQYIDVNVGLGGLSLTAGADTVDFKDLNRNDLVFARPGSTADLVITDKLTGETLTVHNQFNGFQTGALGPEWFDRVEWFQFADGSRISWQDVEQLVTTGGDGNDQLYGDILADQMVGGKGDDLLSGGGGGDTYVFNVGDGHDTINDSDTSFLGSGFLTIDGNPDVLQLGEGITPNDISFARNGQDVDFILGTNGDRVTIQGQDSYIYTGVFGNLSSTRIEEVRFADGTVWTWHDLNQHMIAAETTDGNDVTVGTSTDDTFASSPGDDILDGGDGNDTYNFGRGSGHDIIREHVDNVLDGNDDKLIFGPGIALSDLSFARNGDDLTITINDTGDSVTVQNQFTWSALYTWNDVETFQFADGSSISNDDIQQILLTGTPGDDTLIGFSSSDVLDGGAGNDTLIGGDGSDAYVFGRGYGTDTIEESVDYVMLGDFDTLRFADGVAPSDILLSRNGNDLTLSIAGTSDSVTVAGQFDMSAWFTWHDIEQFAFVDGTVWTKDQVSQMLLRGTDGGDVLQGTSGNDYLNGGAGNDTLIGGDGSDTYVFGRGYGNDTIYESVDYVLLGDDDQVIFNADIAPEDLIYSRDGDNLTIGIAGTSDTLTIVGQFTQTGWYSWNDIERFVFADGTILTKDEIRQKVLTGTPGDDHIIGFNTDDVLDGAAGDDILEGKDGSDTYRFGVGDGHDTILETLDDGRDSEDDTLAFKEGISPSDVTVTREGQDAIFTLASGDSIRVAGQFNEGYNEFLSSNDVEHVTFADGTAWSKIDVDRLSIHATAGDDVILGTWYQQTYDGLAGNDTISAGGGDDILIGGAGDDLLQGDGGSDTYIYNLGDGSDTIYDYNWGDDQSDKIQFGAGITPDNIRLSNNPNDSSAILISFTDQPGSILVQNQWQGDAGIEFFSFADGTTWDQNQIAAAFITGQATDGDDLIFSPFGGAVNGLQGNDTIQTGDADDVITGGPGDDYLSSGYGNDIYVYNVGDGNDTIYDYSWNDDQADRIRFGAGISPDDIQLSNNPNDSSQILISFADQSGSIRVQNQWQGDAGIEFFDFADGTTWDQSQIAAAFGTDQATAGNDLIFGTPFGGEVSGGAGNDTINTGDADDVIIGGSGDDYLSSGYGNDVYVYNLGDGNDTIYDYSWNNDQADRIRFGAGITPDDLVFANDGNGGDIVIRFANTPGSILVQSQWQGDAGIELLEFADGTIWDQTQIAAAFVAGQETAGNDVIYGTSFGGEVDGGAGNDTINTGDADDVIVGGLGDDYLSSGYGNDIYVYNLGDGNDTIYDYSWNNDQADRLRFGAGISPDDILVSRSSTGGDDIRITFKETDGSIVLKNEYWGDAGVEIFDFADGTTLTDTQLEAGMLTTTSSADSVHGTDAADQIWGLEGDDVLFGSGGDDVIGGGQGNDRIVGGTGDDILEGGSGDDRIYGDLDSALVPTGPDLIQNGSFEVSGDIAGYWGDGIFNSTMPGWTKLNSQVWEQIYSGHAGVNASDGNFWVDLDSGGGSGSNMDIQQAVDGLTDGQQLLLSFDHIGRTGNDSSDFEVLWNGALVATYTDRGTTLITDTLQLTTAAGSNTLEFVGVGAEDNAGAALDNVHLYTATTVDSGGDDTINGGAGDDVMTGGFGSDTFLFHPGSGNDIITDFATDTTTGDKLRFDTSVFADWAHLLGATQQAGSDLLITLDAQDSVTLKNVSMANFSASNAQFA